MLKRNDRDSIAKLQAETVDGVIDQDHVFHIDVLEDSEVLDVHVISGLDTAVPVESVLEKFTFGVYVV